MTSPTDLNSPRSSTTTAAGPIPRLLAMVRFDPAPTHRQPNLMLVAIATVLAAVLSLLADFGLAKLAVQVFPSTRGYEHFQFSDYSKLTLIGVVGAGLAWPIVARLCAAPRWLYFRLAVLVTAVLLVPDFYIWLVQGQPGKAVLFLMFMHLAIGVITYNAVVRLAPVRAAMVRDRQGL